MEQRLKKFRHGSRVLYAAIEGKEAEIMQPQKGIRWRSLNLSIPLLKMAGGGSFVPLFKADRGIMTINAAKKLFPQMRF